MAFKWADIDPDEVLDYIHDWSDRLLGPDPENNPLDDAVVGAPECIVDSGEVTVTDPPPAMDGNVQKVWLLGGTPGAVKLTIRVHTEGGRTYDEGVKLNVKER